MKKMSLITLVLASVVSTQVAAGRPFSQQGQQDQQNQKNSKRQMIQQKMQKRFQDNAGNKNTQPTAPSGQGLNPETGSAPGSETTPLTTSPTTP